MQSDNGKRRWALFGARIRRFLRDAGARYRRPAGGGLRNVTYASDGAVPAVDKPNHKVTAKVEAGLGGIAVTPDGKFVYVANGPPGQGHYVPATTPDGKRDPGKSVWVARAQSNNVSVIATASNAVTATIEVGRNPGGVVISPDGKFVYVRNSDTVSVIDTASNTVTATVAVEPSAERELAVTPDGRFVYVANFGSLESPALLIPARSRRSTRPAIRSRPRSRRDLTRVPWRSARTGNSSMSGQLATPNSL
jgi:YVTN family beta-propeller protein